MRSPLSGACNVQGAETRGESGLPCILTVASVHCPILCLTLSIARSTLSERDCRLVPACQPQQLCALWLSSDAFHSLAYARSRA